MFDDDDYDELDEFIEGCLPHDVAVACGFIDSDDDDSEQLD